VFSGKAIHTIDDKGRLVLPSNFRKALEGDSRVVLAIHEDQCLMLHRQADFNAEAEKREAELMDTPEGRELFRYFMGSAQEVELDKAGRVLIGEEFRRRARIELSSEVVIVGMRRYAEIWNRPDFEAQDARGAASFFSPRKAKVTPA
jgi:MraZ protein